jgi:hypothetical protein
MPRRSSDNAMLAPPPRSLTGSSTLQTHFVCSGTAFSVSTGAVITLLNVLLSCETPLAVCRTPADPRGVYSAFGGDDYLFYNFVSRCAPPPASALAHRLLT